MQLLNLLDEQRQWSPCIFYVDDQANHFSEFEKINAEEGYQIHHCMDVKNSLLMALELQPDIIILSLEIQDMDLIEVIGFYKSHAVLSNTAIMATSQFQESEKITSALANGVDDFLLQPYCPALVHKRIRNTLQIIANQKSDRIQMALSNVLEESLNEIYIFDAESLHLFYASRGATKNLGYTAQELHTMTPFQLVKEDSRAQFEEAFQSLLESQDSQAFLNTEFMRKGGTYYPAEVYLQQTTVFSKPAIVALVMDITKLVQEREQVERLARAIESSADAVFVTDTTGTITYVNPAFSELYGWSAEEAIGQTPKCLKSHLNPESTYQEIWSQLLSGKTWKGTLINRRKVGQGPSGLPLLGQSSRQAKNWLEEFRWVHMTVSPIYDKQGDCISYVALQRDITEKVLDEKKQAQKHIQAVIRAGVAKSLQQQTSLKEKLDHVLSALLGISEYQHLRRGCLYLNNPETNQCELISTYGKFSIAPPLTYHEYWFVEEFAEFPRSVIQTHIINQCNCDSTSNEECNAQESHGHYLIPISHLGEPLGAMVLSSESFPDDDPDHIQFLQSIGELIGMAVINDRLTEDLKTAQQKAVEANISKDMFLANISHEIRTPMTAILGYSEILMDQLESKSQVKMIDTIKQNGDYLLCLINDLLDLSKINSQKMAVELMQCSPSQILFNVESLLKVRADKKCIGYITEFDGAIPEHIQTDPTRFKQILVNLVGNAIKFTDQGAVRVVARYLMENQVPFLQVEVVDTGVGITDNQMQRLFQPFVQADASMTRRFGGTGLGLTICKKLTEMLNGSISVTSISSVGSTFVIKIPTGVAADVNLVQYDSGGHDLVIEKVAAPAVPDNLKEYFGFSPRVLVADDGADNQHLLSYILKKWQCEYDIVENGKLAVEAVQAAEEQGAPFDIILMDIQMPVMDGFTATKTLRDSGYSKPIIAITAHAMNTQLQKCIEAGCDAHTSKPINRKQLLSLICEYTMREQAQMTN